MIIPPCYDPKTRTDCPRRKVYCRSSCLEWEAYERAKAVYDAERLRRQTEDDLMRYHAKELRKRIERRMRKR